MRVLLFYLLARDPLLLIDMSTVVAFIAPFQLRYKSVTISVNVLVPVGGENK